MKTTFNPKFAGALQLGKGVVAAAAVAAGLWAGASFSWAAEGRCGARNDMSQTLEKRYSEVPVAVGLVDGKTVIEIYARADGETWTIVTSRADGISCVIGAGKAWQSIPVKVIGPEA